MLYEKCDCKLRHVVLLCMLCMRDESNVFFFYIFCLFNLLYIAMGGALVFLGGAEAPASPSLAPPMLRSSLWVFLFYLIIFK